MGLCSKDTFWEIQVLNSCHRKYTDTNVINLLVAFKTKIEQIYPATKSIPLFENDHEISINKLSENTHWIVKMTIGRSMGKYFLLMPKIVFDRSLFIYNQLILF